MSMSEDSPLSKMLVVLSEWMVYRSQSVKVTKNWTCTHTVHHLFWETVGLDDKSLCNEYCDPDRNDTGCKYANEQIKEFLWWTSDDMNKLVAVLLDHVTPTHGDTL